MLTMFALAMSDAMMEAADLVWVCALLLRSALPLFQRCARTVCALPTRTIASMITLDVLETVPNVPMACVVRALLLVNH